MIVARVKDLSKVYYQGDQQIIALNNVSLDLNQAEFLSIMGPSGSGKSTLLHCWATLDKPSSGYIEIAGHDVTRLNDNNLTKLRRSQIGFIFQSYNLIPTLNAKDNILLPLLIMGKKIKAPEKAWFNEIVKNLNLVDRLRHLPTQLSGGQQQRVAVARALMTRPKIIFADEPSGNLDTKTGNELLQFLHDINQHFKQAIIMVTHSPKAASYSSRTIFLKDGSVFDSIYKPSISTVTDKLATLEK